ncbi:MAG: cytochrome c biogenesis protein CcdA [Armatimonadota bacterium]|nr:cytochrome c biogenesis protein CcdA [Armatimonadota bacterium]
MSPAPARRAGGLAAPGALGMVLLIALAHPAAGLTGPPVTIYFNGSCHDCVPYLDHELEPLLRSLGVGEITRRDYIVERRYRKELLDRSLALGIPPNLQGHMTIFIGDRVILQGHVPATIVRDLFAPANAARYARVVVLQDKMTSHGDAVTEYTIWTPGGPTTTYPLGEPIATYLAGLPPLARTGAPAAGVAPTGTGAAGTPETGLGFAATVLGAGLLDGINPCAFSVLLFFVAFLFTLQRDRTDLLLFGLVYIGAIYVTYLGIGLGLLKVFQLGAPHLFAKIGAWMMLFLGLVNIKDFFWYGVGPSLTVPKVGMAARDRWMRRATLPATAVVGFLVGICEFPCTGGVYVGILGLLAAQTTYATGLGYLLAYNLMFILPLVALLLLIGNRRVVGQFSRWMAANKRHLRLGQGLVMLAIGAAILVWFV